jgi:hypothetical protein
MVLRICEDSWGFVRFVKTDQIFWKSLGFVVKNWMESLKLRIHWSQYESNLLKALASQYKSFWGQDSQDESTGTWFPDTISVTL